MRQRETPSAAGEGAQAPSRLSVSGHL